jgi:hypothetical protein
VKCGSVVYGLRLGFAFLPKFAHEREQVIRGHAMWIVMRRGGGHWIGASWEY